MAGGQPGAVMVPLERVELVSQEMELIADVIRQLYIEHAATFRCADPARVDGNVRSVIAGGLVAGLLRYGGVQYTAELSPAGAPLVAAVRQGSGVITTAREELRFLPGDVFMVPAGMPAVTTMNDAGYAALQLPWAVAGELAEARAGVAAADLRFEAMAPISAAVQRTFARTAHFICRQLVSSGDTEISPLVAQEMTWLAAAAMLETFPNTAMTVPYLTGPGWVPQAAVRRAATFIEAYADRPVTLDQIAAVAGVTSQALRSAFRRYLDVTPIGYLRRVRLERARAELQAADPASGITVADVARRWGWSSPGQFAKAYGRRFGVLPDHTLRTEGPRMTRRRPGRQPRRSAL